MSERSPSSVGRHATFRACVVGANKASAELAPPSRGIRAEIWVVRPDGTGLRQLTNDRVPDVRPFWVER